MTGEYDAAARSPSGRFAPSFAMAFAILFALSCVPLLLTALPPLLDYPNHLARMYLLPRLPDAALARYYIVQWTPIPDLAMDGIVPFLAKVVPLEWAGKLFIVLIFLLLAGGTAAIHRVLFGRWSLWSLLGFLLLYTRLLLWGFMGYLFGCGLALTAFAIWIALDRRHWLLRLIAGTVFAVAIYFAHLLAFGIYAVMIASYEFGQIWLQRKSIGAALRDLVIGGLPFLPALALMTHNSSTGRIIFANPLRKFDLLFSVFDNYSRPFDVVCFVLIVLVVGFAYWRRWVTLAPAMVLPMLGLVAVYIAMPTQLFTAAGVDRRIPMMIFLALIGGSAWQPRAARIEPRFLAGVALLFAVRLAVIAAIWFQAGRLYAQLLPGLDMLPRGSCVAIAFGKDSIQVAKAPLTHFTTLAVARRGALVTTIFHYPMQQPITLQPDANRIADALAPDGLWYQFVDNTTPLPPASKAALRQCGYVAFADPRAFTLKNTSGLTPLFVKPRYQLYRVAADAAATPP
ncbi:MAG TPA: hypothetical protein VG328_25340 [Stellaceae bacterium]|nr:hypothetical protein [Stellaceae bacterium]